MLFQRSLSVSFEKWLSQKEVIILLGPRQVGKTTFVQTIVNQLDNAKYFNCELPYIKDILESKDLNRIRNLFGSNQIIALDEAQGIKDIGLILKIIYDEMSEYKLIATGSSSFDLSSNIQEALTGRNIKFVMLPLSQKEVQESILGINEQSIVSNLAIYGFYPEVVNFPIDQKADKLLSLSSDYLFKDILMYDNVKNPHLLRSLLKLLALQIGSQVSINELANSLKVSSQTIDRYIDLLEKSFVIFRLPSYSSNHRNELKKSFKVFFYDLGIRNAIINNFTDLSNRNDVGAIWENYCIAERYKQAYIHKSNVEFYFWRSYDGAEIDLLEIKNQEINAFEFKWNRNRKTTIPKSFFENYNPQSFKVISLENYYELF